MAFEKSSKSKSKNQFAARLVTSNDNMIGWVHLTDDTARKVFMVNNVSEITYAAAAEKLPQLLDNDRTSVVITDLTAPLVAVDINDY